MKRTGKYPSNIAVAVSGKTRSDFVRFVHKKGRSMSSYIRMLIERELRENI